MQGIVDCGKNCVLLLFSLVVMRKYKNLVLRKEVKLSEFNFKEPLRYVKNKPWRARERGRPGR